jgi:hypothetical protein
MSRLTSFFSWGCNSLISSQPEHIIKHYTNYIKENKLAFFVYTGLALYFQQRLHQIWSGNPEQREHEERYYDTETLPGKMAKLEEDVESLESQMQLTEQRVDSLGVRHNSSSYYSRRAHDHINLEERVSSLQSKIQGVDSRLETIWGERNMQGEYQRIASVSRRNINIEYNIESQVSQLQNDVSELQNQMGLANSKLDNLGARKPELQESVFRYGEMAAIRKLDGDRYQYGMIFTGIAMVMSASWSIAPFLRSPQWMTILAAGAGEYAFYRSPFNSDHRRIDCQFIRNEEKTIEVSVANLCRLFLKSPFIHSIDQMTGDRLARKAGIEVSFS